MASVDLRKYIPVAGAQPTPTPPPGQNVEDWSRAQNIVNMKFQPQENDVYRQLDVVQQFLDRDINTQKQYGEIADQRLAGISTQLTGQLEQGVQQTKSIFDVAKQNVGGTYDQMQQQVGQLGQGIQSGLQGQAQQLGQEQALTGYMNPIDRIKAEIAGIQARGAESKAGSLANLDSLSSQFQAIGKSKVGGAQQEWAQRRGDLASKVQGAITELQLGAQTDALGKLGKLSDLAEQRGRTLTETLAQLADARTQREIDAANAALKQQAEAFDQMIKLRNLELSQAKHSWNVEKGSADLALKAQKAAKPEQITSGVYGLKQMMDKQFGEGKMGTFRGSARRLISDLEGASSMLKMDPYKIGTDLINKIRTGKVLNENEKALATEIDPGYAGFKSDPGKYFDSLQLALQVYFNKYGQKR